MESLTAGKHGMDMEQRQALASFWAGALSWDASMADYCTMKAGGRVGAMIVASNRVELSGLISWLKEQKIRWRVIGRGSNILVSSQGYDGVLIVLGGDFCSIHADETEARAQDNVGVRVGAGCSAAKIVSWSVHQSLSGLEFMAGIPGSVGGAVCMNAGAWGCEIGNVVETVSFADKHGKYHEIPGVDLEFSYRKMAPKDPALQDAVVVGALFSLLSAHQRGIIETCRDYVARRKEKQPAGAASAGSFFKNPPGDSAGRLIEAAGLKGLQRGEAVVSVKHANFIINAGNASADDVIDLMREVQDKVYRFSGVRLEPEVHLL